MRRLAEIRSARATDVAAIAHIHLDSSKVAYRDILDPVLLDGLSLAGRIALWERRVAQIGPHGRLLVQCVGGAIIGFALCDRSDVRGADSSVCELKSFYITPAYWGGGFGGALLAHVVTDFKNRGFGAMILWTICDNRRARDFYAHAGFRCDDVTRLTRREESGFTLEYEEILYSRAL